VLHAALKAEFLAGRIAAARVLKATGDTSWPPQIVPVLDSPRVNERVAAAELLLSMPAHAAKAREILKTEMSGSEVPLRREAIRALTSQADADPWSYLLLMRDADPVVRVYAAGVLMRKLGPAAPVAAGRSPR
jgi:HEAT repeat protein